MTFERALFIWLRISFTSFFISMIKKIFFLSLVLCASNAFSKPYFGPKEVPPTLIDTPFKPESVEWKKEIEDIIKIQRKPDEKEVQLALEERELSPDIMMKFVDERITRQDYPKLFLLLDRVEETSRDITDAAKTYWNGKRPYLSDKKVKALIPAHDNPCYPSGHTTGSYTYAHVLGLLFPDKREELKKHAERIGQHRVLVGMHFPKDLVGGKQLSLLITGGFLQNRYFLKDLERAREELDEKYFLKTENQSR